jgi:acid phosphatase
MMNDNAALGLSASHSRGKGSFVMKTIIRLVAVVATALSPFCLSAQQVSAPQAEAAPRMSALAPGEGIQNLDKLKDEIKQYHDCTCKCGCYAKDLDLQADRAIAFLRRRAAHSSSADKLSLVLDIDETTLSNYEEMVNAGFAYDGNAFNAWVESAKAPAIPGTLRIYKEAIHLGVRVFFVTGRPESQRAVTEQNLRSQGFDHWEQLVLRQAGQETSTALEYKSAARRAIQSEGNRIVLNVGDQWSDLKGQPEAEYSVKYPDPYYFLK